MAENGSISFEGMEQLMRSLDAVRVEVNRAASMGLRAAGMNIIADAQENLRKNKSWATGLLGNSGRVISNDDNVLDVGFFDNSDKAEGYAHYVEYGRKAGKFPPVGALDNWIFKKFQLRVERGEKVIKRPTASRPERKRSATPRPQVDSQQKQISGASLAFLIARKIARHGSTPHPFFNPAVERNMPHIVKALTDAIRKVIK